MLINIKIWNGETDLRDFLSKQRSSAGISTLSAFTFHMIRCQYDIHIVSCENVSYDNHLHFACIEVTFTLGKKGLLYEITLIRNQWFTIVSLYNI